MSWSTATQALIYNPHTKKVIGINALGVAPTGVTAEFYHSSGYRFPPAYGPLAAVTPGTPGGLMTMLAQYGRLSLADVLAPAIQMADGYAIEAEITRTIERNKDEIKKWKYSPAIMLTHPGAAHEAPEPGEVFVQKDLAATWRKLVAAEREARRQGKTRKRAIYAAYDRLYRGDIARELVHGVHEDGGLITMQGLARWHVRIEEPVHTSYKGIEVYKLPIWQQGPAMLQSLNILEHADLASMGYNPPLYIHTIYQTTNLAFADHDFYYGDPYRPPEEPMQALLSKEYAAQDTTARSGQQDRVIPAIPKSDSAPHRVTPKTFGAARNSAFFHDFYSGTTSIQRHRAGQVSARHAHADARAQGRNAVSCVRRAGRRLAGAEPPAVFPRHRRVQHVRPAGDGGAEHQQLPEALIIRR